MQQQQQRRCRCSSKHRRPRVTLLAAGLVLLACSLLVQTADAAKARDRSKSGRWRCAIGLPATQAAATTNCPISWCRGSVRLPTMHAVQRYMLQCCPLSLYRRPPPGPAAPGAALFTKVGACLLAPHTPALLACSRQCTVLQPAPPTMYDLSAFKPPCSVCSVPRATCATVSLLLLQEEDIISWDSDELNRIHNLHIREFQDIAVRLIIRDIIRGGCASHSRQQQRRLFAATPVL